jgi:hypothetical protein
LLPYKRQTLNQSEIDGGCISKVCIVPPKQGGERYRQG